MIWCAFIGFSVAVGFPMDCGCCSSSCTHQLESSLPSFGHAWACRLCLCCLSFLKEQWKGMIVQALFSCQCYSDFQWGAGKRELLNSDVNPCCLNLANFWNLQNWSINAAVGSMLGASSMDPRQGLSKIANPSPSPQLKVSGNWASLYACSPRLELWLWETGKGEGLGREGGGLVKSAANNNRYEVASI